MIQNSSNFPEGPFLLPHFEKHPHLPMTISLPGSPCGDEPQRPPTQCPSPGVVWVSFPAHSTLGRKPCPLGLTSGSVPPLTSPPGLQVLCLHLRSLPQPPPPLGRVSWKMVRSSSDSWTFAGSPCWPSCSLWLFLEAECQPIPKLLKGHMHPDSPTPSLRPRRMGMGPAGSVLGGNGHPPNPDSQVPEALPHKERI